MPPRTSNLRVCHSHPRPIPERKQKSNSYVAQQESPNRRRRFSPSQTKASPKIVRSCPQQQRQKQDAPERRQYDRDFLLSCRNTPLSQRIPNLPEIVGVTVPKPKENKEIPHSLKVKLEKRGVILNDVTNRPANDDAQKTLSEKSFQTDATSRPPFAKTNPHKLDKAKTWQSCMLHVI